MRLSSLLAGVAVAFAASARALPKEDGTRFFVKGVAYQEMGSVVTTDDEFQEPDTFIDPLANPNFCERDVPYLKQLGVNAVRVYSVDPSLNHDGCMSQFEAAGIYTIIDLSQPLNGSIDRAAPKWTSNLLDLYLQTIDTFSGYSNVLAYTVGNEIVRDVPSTVAGPFIKAAVRDVKAYIKSKGYSQLVTYASTDGPDWVMALATYLSCGDEGTTVDMYGLNNYRWKGDATESVYDSVNQNFGSLNVPVYFSEFGSPASPPRLFTEVDALFGDTMSQIWSGGLAFAYFQSIQSGFGLVDISTDGKTVTPNEDFTRLQQHYTSVTFATTPSQADAGTTQYPTCTAADPTVFVGSLTLPPTPNQDACNCAVQKAFACIFNPQTVNTSAILGPLFDFTCPALGKLNSNACDALSADGAAGKYGPLSSCDPESQLSYVFTAYYTANNMDAASCNFAGNATLNPNAPTTVDAANAAATSCLASAQGVSVPTGPSKPAESSATGGKGNTTTGGSSSGGDGAAFRNGYSVAAVVASIAFALLGAFAVIL
ncbi:Glucanosyltransferase-domain-containing protein [Auriculariales sp. MPI-PUGE-AT-0066]|nr:Glucanosyltransferase-domain-containing protein [Auriculariales sp. MPI-PUGE-AT-0066]